MEGSSASTVVWLTPALTALLLYGLAQGFARKYVAEVSPARFCLFFIVARSLVALIYFSVREHPSPFDPAGRTFLILAIFVYILDGLGWILYYKSILLGPITIVGTLSAAYPALTVLFARLFLGEVLTTKGYAGVAFVIAGCLGMAYSPAKPDQKASSRGWIPLAAGALFLWGAAQTLLKYAYGFPHASEVNAMVFMTMGGWLTLGVYGLLYGRRSASQEASATQRIREWGRAMFPMGMMAGGDAAVLVATRFGPVSIVAPLTGAYPIVTIAFAALALRERVTLLQAASIAATLAGMCLVV
jgi:drug/metabolite transporter (DMT)-like permease